MATRILATGPESSGTRFLTELLEAGGADAVHRSQPEGIDWIDLEAMLEDFDFAVIVVRGLYATARSAEMRGVESSVDRALEKRRRSLARLAPILGDPRVLVVTYESLEEPREVEILFELLGLPFELELLPPFTNENRKHYS